MNNGQYCDLRAFIFDLDGTLVDSKLDLVNSINAMLREIGQPEQPTELVASYVGHGAPQLIAGVLGPTASDAQRGEALAIFLRHYQQQKLNLTHPYPGVVEGLRALAGFPQAVLTNKPTQLSVDILRGLGLVQYFRFIYGGDSFPQKKPDPTGALQIASELGVLPAETAMVGDSDVDIQTARNCGMVAIAVKYGFGQHNRSSCPADRYINSLVELFPLASRAT